MTAEHNCHAAPEAAPSAPVEPGTSRWQRFKVSRAAPSILLAAFALGTSSILAGFDGVSRAPIAARAAEDLMASLQQVIPDDLHDNDPGTTVTTVNDSEEGPVQVYLGTKNGKLTAMAFELTGYGYGGAIRILIGAQPDGTILGVRVLSHSETPGLGDNIELAKSKWILGFNGKSLGDPAPSGWKVKKDGGVFDQFSGATITPRAVVGTVFRGLEFIKRNSAALEKDAPTTLKETS